MCFCADLKLPAQVLGYGSAGSLAMEPIQLYIYVCILTKHFSAHGHGQAGSSFHFENNSMMDT